MEIAYIESIFRNFYETTLEETTLMGEIFTRLIKMPARIKGYTAIDEEGNYNIYLNERLSCEQQRITYLHEMAHIARGDWDKASVEDAEKDI